MARAAWPVLPTLLLFAAGPSFGAPGALVPPPSPSAVEVERRFDVNDLDLATGNDGSIASYGELPGLVYPRGSGVRAIFAGGLWVGARVGGLPRVTAAQYVSQWSPGRILPGGPEPPAAGDLRNWKVVPVDAFAAAADTGFAAATGTLDPVAHESWSAYVAFAGSRGAPVHSIPMPGPGGPVSVPGPDLPGSLALWSVFNDAGRPTLDRLRVEVRQTVFGFPGDPIAYVRWTLRSDAAAMLESTYVALWTDPDLGGASDDLMGWDDVLDLGYVYNATNTDNAYGARPPAVGMVFLSGPPGLSPAAFRGTFLDAGTPLEQYRYLQGLDLVGNEAIDPSTGLPTRFDFPGDPLTRTGTVDSTAGEKRMQVSVGPFDLAPGDSVTFVFALVAGRGYGRLDSIARMRCAARAAHAAAAANFIPPFPAPPEDCRFLAPHPVTAAAWAGWCANPSPLPSGALDRIAALVKGRSRSFSPAPPLVDAFCDGVSEAGGTARERAGREYLAFLANVVAPAMALSDPAGGGVGLREWNPVSCAGLAATTLGELAERAPPDVPLHVNYVGEDAPGQSDLRPVFWGGSAYNGGVGFGEELFPSSLSVANQPDSFPPVEIRFEAASDQKAYRYLRLELVDGSEPPAGREYRYAGYRRVPFRVVDTESGQTLEAAFLERAVVDAAGTLRPPFQQPATFDSTWGPTDGFTDSFGGHELLFILARPYGADPRPAMEVDGLIAGLAGPPPPVLYVLWLRRDPDDPVIDDGDKLEVLRTYVTPSNGIDQRLLALAQRPADDPEAIAEYDRIAACLSALNAGFGIPVECATALPNAVARDTTDITAQGVRLGWCAGSDVGELFPLRRQPANDLARARFPGLVGWIEIGSLLPDASRRMGALDPDVLAGEQWTYALFHPSAPQVPIDVATVTIPGGFSGLSMSAVTPWRNRGARIVFNLLRRGPVVIEVFTAAGRRLQRVDLGELAAGPHAQNLEPTAVWRPGVVFIRLRQEEASVVAKAVVLR